MTGIVENLAHAACLHDAAIVAHDRQIEALIAAAEKNQAKIDRVTEELAETRRQWQGYLNTLRRQ